jgi:hypothetical protein
VIFKYKTNWIEQAIEMHGNNYKMIKKLKIPMCASKLRKIIGESVGINRLERFKI